MSFPTRPAIAILLLAGLALGPAHVDAAKPGRVLVPQVTLEKSAARLHVRAPDVAKLQREDRLRDEMKGAPLRYGRVVSTGVLDARAGAGVWRMGADGAWRWTLEVSAVGATSLEFTFSRFRLPHGASLTIRSPDGKEMLGPFTDADNPVSGHLHTPMLTADQALLELRVPAHKRKAVELTLASLAWGYRDPFVAVRAKSGNCNIDAACPEGNAWREQIAAVAGYSFSTSGDRLICTGTLMNTGVAEADASQPRFATANHCVSLATEAASMVFYWGYESPTCRAVGSVENGTDLPVRANTRAVQLGGASLIATNRETDFTVVQLNSPVPAEAQAWYSGWDRSDALPNATLGIHHPSGHEKRLSFDADPPDLMRNCIIAGASDGSTHWQVGPYEAGTTEGGSSGSGLWNTGNGLLVGVLSGGTASCATASGYDCYGRLNRAWEADSLTGSTVRDALDRSAENPQTMPGKGSCDAPQVSLDSAAFGTSPRAGETFEIKATASGGAGNYTYLWDTDGDGVIEREGGASMRLSFPGSRAHNVWVRVRDAEGCVGSATAALEILAPEISVTEVGARQQVCGNGNGRIDPGERYRLPITFRNDGAAPLPAGSRALLLPASGLAGNGVSNQFGYEGAAECGYAFIDIARGPDAVPALETYVANGNSYGPRDDARSTTINLGGNGFGLYGARYAQAVMSTNGYVSFDPEESGGDYWVSCDEPPDFGAKGPQLRPYHDDMVVGEGQDDGLRYRHFPTCPRLAGSGVAQACHVFQWSGMGYYISDDQVEGDFEFQAVAYERTGEVAYQYHVAAPDEGDLANIGLIGIEGEDPLVLACETWAAPARAETAMCIHSPQALAAATPGLRMEHSTLVLPAIAAGASATVKLPVTVRADAACATPLGLHYLATASTRSYSSQPSRHAMGQVADACVRVDACTAEIPEIRAQSGNYYNLARSGTGFNYHQLGGIWYSANPDHTPTWYTIVGQFEDNQLSAPILRTTLPGGPPPIEIGTPPPGTARLPVQHEQVGRMHLARIDTGRLLMAWEFDDGRRGAELIDHAARDLSRPDPDHTFPWYSPSQSGWGLDVESTILDQRRFEAVVPYFYDAVGEPRWLLSDGYITDGFLRLNSYRPHCPGCPRFADWGSRTQPAGDLVLRWTGTGQGEVSINISLPPPLSGSWNRSRVPLVPIRADEP